MHESSGPCLCLAPRKVRRQSGSHSRLDPNHPFIKALREMLLRLPDSVYDEIESRVQFIVEAHEAFAFNVHLN